MGKNEIVYNRAKPWQIGFFALNNTATNLYLFMFGFISYYATGIAGLLVMVVSTIITAMRFWDGVTDPIIGFIIDKTDTKFGKFRPFMILGNVVLAITTLIIFKTTHLIPEGFRLIYFILIYAIYIIGYTFQTAVTKSGQTVLTNDPKQRPVFSLFDAFYNTFLFTGGQILVASVLVPKHGGFTMGFFNEFLLYGMVLSAVFTILAVVGISEKDRTEFFTGDTSELTFKDYWPVIKDNRAIQMLIVAASTDKLAGSVAGNASVLVMLYGILIGNYALSGTMGMITLIPTLLLTAYGVRFAGKFGSKKAMAGATWIAIGIYSLLFLFFNVADYTTISLTSINVTTIIFIGLMILGAGASGVSGNIVIPMIADCSDYETYRTGKYVPGMMGTLFSFVDKLISSLGATIVGGVVAMIGFTTEFPQVGDAATTPLFWATMFLFLGMPVLGWIASVSALKFYPLDDKMMEEVQQTLHDRKVETQVKA